MIPVEESDHEAGRSERSWKRGLGFRVGDAEDFLGEKGATLFISKMNILFPQRFAGNVFSDWCLTQVRIGDTMGQLRNTVLSGTSCMSCGQAEQPFGRGLNFLLGDPGA